MRPSFRAISRVLAFSVLSLGALVGCSSAPPRAQAAPEDFALGLTILADASEESARTGGVLSRSAWYLVEADAQLRAAEGERLPNSLTPPVLRQLTPEEMDELWNAASTSGLARSLAAESGASDAPRPGDQPGTAIVYLHADGKRSASRIDLRAQTPQADATRQLATLLARWAGVER